MGFSESFTGTEFDAAFAGSAATLDQTNDRADLSTGDLVSVAGAISNDEFNEFDLTFNPELTSLYSSGIVYCYILKDGVSTEMGARVYLARQSAGGGADQLVLAFRSAQFGSWAIAQTVDAQDWNTIPAIKSERNSAGQWTISVNGTPVITNAQEPTAMTAEANFNAGLIFSNASGGFVHSVVSEGLSRYIEDIDGDNEIRVGQTNIPVNFVGRDLTPTNQEMTLGGVPLTIVQWDADALLVSALEPIDLLWGGLYTLRGVDDTDPRLLNDVRLLAPVGWDTVVFSGAPDGVETDSFYEFAQSDAGLGGAGYTMQPGDVLAYQTASGLTVDSETVPSVVPPATVTAAYKIFDSTNGVWSQESSYTIADDGVAADVPPVMPADASPSINEGELAVGFFAATQGNNITYSLSGADASAFTIGASGQLDFISAPDFETKATYVVDVVAINGSGSDSQTLTISVLNIAEQLPSISITAGNTVTLETGANYIDPAWTWGDDVVSGQPVTWSGSVDTSTPGSYTRTATATNSVGSVTQDYVVTVSTTTASVLPTIATPGGTTTAVQLGDPYSDPAWTWGDDIVSGQPVTWSGSVDTSTPGTYTRTATATNSVGSVTQTYSIMVQNGVLPVITSPGPLVVMIPADQTTVSSSHPAIIAWMQQWLATDTEGNAIDVAISMPHAMRVNESPISVIATAIDNEDRVTNVTEVINLQQLSASNVGALIVLGDPERYEHKGGRYYEVDE